jgi:hypothetical protein
VFLRTVTGEGRIVECSEHRHECARAKRRYDRDDTLASGPDVLGRR